MGEILHENERTIDWDLSADSVGWRGSVCELGKNQKLRYVHTDVVTIHSLVSLIFFNNSMEVLLLLYLAN